MPRPSKHVSPDTLGGRIRAAREHLHLSLAEVADGHYSTSLISQIERNRVDPSQDSLRFLAGRLKLPLTELELLAQQHRESEVEAHQYKLYEDLRIEATQLLANKDYSGMLGLLENLHFPHVPALQRWQLAALRGRCYFEQQKFLKAQQDFMYAISEQPKLEGLPPNQRHELMVLHLYLASTYREVQQFDDALEHYQTTLQMANRDTPFGYVAEIHWGIALIAFAQANSLQTSLHRIDFCKETKLRVALEHAENARFLYRSIGEQLRAALVTCQIAQIEYALGNTEKVRTHLKDVLSSWSAPLNEPATIASAERCCRQEEANVVSAAACLLAGIELEAKNYTLASVYADQALEASKLSSKSRRVDAYLMRGRILEAIDPKDPEAEEAFRHATKELEDTHHIAARIGAHVRLGCHLLKRGKIEESEQELERTCFLSELASASAPLFIKEDIPLL